MWRTLAWWNSFTIEEKLSFDYYRSNFKLDLKTCAVKKGRGSRPSVNRSCSNWPLVRYPFPGNTEVDKKRYFREKMAVTHPGCNISTNRWGPGHCFCGLLSLDIDVDVMWYLKKKTLCVISGIHWLIYWSKYYTGLQREALTLNSPSKLCNRLYL